MVPDTDRIVHVSKFRLSDYCTVFQAELFGIYQAVLWLSEKDSSAKIFVDSWSSIQACISCRSGDSLVHRIRQSVSRHFCLNWVRAHSGVYGNEMADLFAKEATMLPFFDYDLCPVSFGKSIVKNIARYNWNQNWLTSENGRRTKVFFPSVYCRLSLDIRMDFISCQFLSGHGKFGEYLSRFRIRSDSYCWCGAADQDPVHLVCRCPRFSRERSLLEIRSGTNLTEDNLPFMFQLFPERLLLFFLNIFNFF